MTPKPPDQKRNGIHEIMPRNVRFKKILLLFMDIFENAHFLALFHEFHCVSSPKALALSDLALTLFH